MSDQVLLCGEHQAAPLSERLGRAGVCLSYTATLPPSDEMVEACDAVILSFGPEDVPRARELVCGIARSHGRSGTLVAALLPAGNEELCHLLLEDGADDASTSVGELAARVKARLSNCTTGRAAFALLVRLARATGGTLDLSACAAAILEGVRRLNPQAVPSLAVVAKPGDNDLEPLFRLENGQLREESWRGLPEIEAALATRREMLFGRGTAQPHPALAVRLTSAGASSALALPLLSEGRCIGVLSLLVPEPPGEAELSLFRAVAGIAVNAVANAQAHTRLEKRRAALEAAYIDRYRELLEANRRLRELNHMKDEFLAICAHDLRSPLNVVLGHSRLLMNGQKGPLSPEGQKSAEAVSRQAKRMLELIEDLLDLRALETGRLELKRKEADLGELVAEACDSMQLLARERGIVLARLLPESGPLLTVDASKMREVLMNLVSNALKFTPTGGRVEVALKVGDDGTVRIEVRDTGPGIPADELPRLFERYRRGREGKANGRGNGLGLAISREIVELHGGAIAVESEAGRGSLFTIALPPTPAKTSSRETARRRPLLLVVEDDADSRAIICDLLSAEHEVLQATNGEDGVRLAREHAPDLILMDLFMPRLDGFAAMEDLRRDPRTAETPVIILSAQGDELTKVRGLNLGASDYLAKPFSGRELLARVEKTLRVAQQREQLRTLAQTDALTGLANYRAFRARLEEEFKRARRYHTPLACVMIDMDNLKIINDQLGHASGNRAIAALADVLKSELRETDFAARYGGDEFVVLLPHTNAEEATVFAERVRERLKQGGTDVEGRISVRASFGVAASDASERDSADELWRRADAALYAAKEGGRNRVMRAPAVSGPVSAAAPA